MIKKHTMPADPFVQAMITVGASQALALSVLILMKHQLYQWDYLLSAKLFLVFVITLFFNYHIELINSGYANLPINAYAFGYLILPVFYLYIKSATRGRLDFRDRDNWVHFLPYLGITLLLAINFYPLSVDSKRELYETVHNCAIGWDSPPWYFFMYYTLFLGIFPLYLFKSFKLLKVHTNIVQAQFSYTEEIGLDWLYRFLWAMIFVGISFVVFDVIGVQFLNMPENVGMNLAFTILLVSIFYLGMYGLRQKIIFFEPTIAPSLGVSVNETVSEEHKYQYSSLTEKKATEYLHMLQAYMKKNKPFLEPKISISEISNRTGIPVNYLSQIINEKLNQNFFDFINSYRVDEFKQLLEKPENHNYTLLSLAFDAGFNSKSTFNALFKKFTDLTPSEYARRLRKQKLFPG